MEAVIYLGRFVLVAGSFVGFFGLIAWIDRSATGVWFWRREWPPL